MARTKRFELLLKEQEQENIKTLSEQFDISSAEILRTGLHSISVIMWKYEDYEIKDRIKKYIGEGLTFQDAIAKAVMIIDREVISKKKSNDELLKESQLKITESDERMISKQDKMIELLTERIEMIEQDRKELFRMVNEKLDEIKVNK